MQCLFFVSLQWTAVLIGASTVISVVGVIVFLLYRRYKVSSQCHSFCFVSTIISCGNMLHILYMQNIFSFRAVTTTVFAIFMLIVSCFRERGWNPPLSLQKERQSDVLWPKDHEKGWCHLDLVWQLVSMWLFSKSTPLAALHLYRKKKHTLAKIHWKRFVFASRESRFQFLVL